MDTIEFYIGFLRDRAKDYLDFLRGIANFLNPRPQPIAAAYTPPFTGGQDTTANYILIMKVRFFNSNINDYDNFYYGNYPVDASETYKTFRDPIADYNINPYTPIKGAIKSLSIVENTKVTIKTDRFPDGIELRAIGYTSYPPESSFWLEDPRRKTEIVGYYFLRADGQPLTAKDNLPNPNPSIPIKDDGLWENKNEPISEQAIVLAPALPLVLVSAIIAGYLNAINAARAALDALDAIKKVADALESLKDLWEKLREFLNDWDKNRNQKKEIVRQAYGGIQGDGTISFYKEGNTKYTAIQLDIVLTSIPNNIGKYLAEYSPNRYPYGGLGYIAFYSINQGILSTHQIEFKRTSYEVPKLAVGFVYHLGLNEQVRGFAFAEFSKLL